MSETTLSVPEIHCGHCKASIEGAVGAIDGVSSAAVDVDQKTVSVEFDSPASIASIVGAIEDQGYDVPSQ